MFIELIILTNIITQNMNRFHLLHFFVGCVYFAIGVLNNYDDDQLRQRDHRWLYFCMWLSQYVVRRFNQFYDDDRIDRCLFYISSNTLTAFVIAVGCKPGLVSVFVFFVWIIGSACAIIGANEIKLYECLVEKMDRESDDYKELNATRHRSCLNFIDLYICVPIAKIYSLIGIVSLKTKVSLKPNLDTNQIISFVVAILFTGFMSRVNRPSRHCDEELYPNLCICDENYCDENIQCCFKEISNISLCVIGVAIGVLCYIFMVDLDEYHEANDLHVFRNGKLYVRRVTTNHLID
jgi:hypothetical protein